MATKLLKVPAASSRRDSDDDDFSAFCRDLTIAYTEETYKGTSELDLEAKGPTDKRGHETRFADAPRFENPQTAELSQRLQVWGDSLDEEIKRKQEEEAQALVNNPWDVTIREFTESCNNILALCRERIRSIRQQVAIVLMNAGRLLWEIITGGDNDTSERQHIVAGFAGEYFDRTHIKEEIERHYGSMRNLGSGGDIDPVEIDDVD